MKTKIKKLSLLILVIAFLSLGTFAHSESSIPTSFTTYTDDTNFFSISYPENWEPAFSIIESLKQEAENLLKSIDEKDPFKNNTVVFFGGVLLDSGNYNPNFGIIIEPLVDDNVKLEDLVEFSVREIKKISEEYREFSRTKTTIDGRQAIILDYEARSFNWPFIHCLSMIMCIDKFLWTTTCCTIPPLNFYDFKNDFYAILKSFKILN